MFEAFRINEPIAKAIINETLEYLAIFLINVINITDTSIIVLGGSVMQNSDIIIPFVQDYITNNSIAAIRKVSNLNYRNWVMGWGDIAGLSLVLP